MHWECEKKHMWNPVAYTGFIGPVTWGSWDQGVSPFGPSMSGPLKTVCAAQLYTWVLDIYQDSR